MANESEQDYQENGMGIRWLEAKRYLVQSLRNPMNVHMVDLEEYDGYGECSCEYYEYMVLPKLKAGKKPFKKCRHIKLAKRFQEKNLNSLRSSD
jgi:hypothetical protein